MTKHLLLITMHGRYIEACSSKYERGKKGCVSNAIIYEVAYTELLTYKHVYSLFITFQHWMPLATCKLSPSSKIEATAFGLRIQKGETKTPP